MIGKLLYQIGSALYGAFGAVHDALISPEQPPTMTTDSLNNAYELNDVAPVNPGSFRDTVKYYIGGTFVVTLILTIVLCRLFPKVGKKVAGKAKTVRRRRRTTTRRRTYRRRK